MGLRKKCDGLVKIWVNISKSDPMSKNILDFDELVLKSDITKQALLTALGIPGPYASDVAAKAGGVSVGQVYFITTSLKLATVML